MKTCLFLLCASALVACGDSGGSGGDAGNSDLGGAGAAAQGAGGPGTGGSGPGGASGTGGGDVGGGPIGGGSGGLLAQGDLVYQGAFRVPQGALGCNDATVCAFDYSRGPIGFRPGHESIYVAGHVYNQQIAELSIPTLVNSQNLSALNTATVLQPFADLAAGQRDHLLAGGGVVGNGGVLGGLLVEGDKLLLSAYGYYDAAIQVVYTHFTANADYAANGVGFSGMKIVGGPDVPQAGFVGGYMAPIPPEWQGQFGGDALTGQAAIPIIGRTSLGPAAFAFHPSDVGVADPAPATALVYYPIDHWVLGTWDTANPYMNMSTTMAGVVFVADSRSVLFFGRHGDTVCYGQGTDVQALDGQPVPGEPGVIYCYDPANPYKGSHGYPYNYKVWAYSADDLLSVKAGQKEPWELVPYAMWNFDLPFAPASRDLVGVSYDAATQRVFLAQANGDGPRPVVHVFSVTPP